MTGCSSPTRTAEDETPGAQAAGNASRTRAATQAPPRAPGPPRPRRPATETDASGEAPAAGAVDGDGGPVIAVVGRPNVGKSTFFARASGRYAEVANVPGTTVSMARRHVRLGGRAAVLVDLPGAFTLTDRREGLPAFWPPAPAAVLRRVSALAGRLARGEAPTAHVPPGLLSAVAAGRLSPVGAATIVAAEHLEPERWAGAEGGGAPGG